MLIRFNIVFLGRYGGEEICVRSLLVGHFVCAGRMVTHGDHRQAEHSAMRVGERRINNIMGLMARESEDIIHRLVII